MTTSSNISSLPDGAPTLRVMPMPTDANIHGDVFGGWIMSQVDIAGAIPATRRAQGRVATISVNAFTFKQPVFVGDLLSFYTEIIKTGRTSITVSVEVYAERKRLQLDASLYESLQILSLTMFETTPLHQLLTLPLQEPIPADSSSQLNLFES